MGVLGLQLVVSSIGKDKFQGSRAETYEVRDYQHLSAANYNDLITKKGDEKKRFKVDNKPLENDHVVYTERQGQKGGDCLTSELTSDLELRRSGGRPTDEVLKQRFARNKQRHLRDSSLYEKGWQFKLNLGEALLLELEEINKRQI